MWKIAYNALLFVALPFFLLLALVNKKMRANLGERLLPTPLDRGHAPLFWIHAASVGEALIAEALIPPLRRADPNRSFLVTTNTFYTRDLLRGRLQGVQVRSLPFDLPWSLHRFLGNVRPSCLVIVETEIWPNLIWTAHRRGIPVFIVNGRLSDRTVASYRRFSFFFRGILECVTLIIAQSEEHGRRFLSLGLNQKLVVSTGNIKYVREVDGISDVTYDDASITFGSIRDNEIDIVVPVIQRLLRAFPDLTLFVAPRQLNLVERLNKDLSAFAPVTRYSFLKKSSGGKPATGLVLVDTVGDLTGLYGRSTVAFVGGSLAPFGGHNILEPLFFGTPVLFGPYTENFHDIAQEITAAGAGMRVSSGGELFDALERLLTDRAVRRSMGSKGLELILKQQEAMEKTVAHIERSVRVPETAPNRGGR
jgi:3-deoxy-D-manno-octulosonic-acid transferase